MSNNNPLPDEMPATWLAQLREAVKQDARKALVWTILGSSVVAAVVTAGSNYILESVKARNAAEIEKHKACLDAKKDELKESRAVYATLSEKFRQLDVVFANCIGTCEAALKSPTQRHLLRFAYDSLDEVSKQLVEIKAAARDARISGELRQSLNDINDAATPILAEVPDHKQKVADPVKMRAFVNLYRQSLQQKIEASKSQIHTASAGLKIEPCS